jgi:hypothetical protein
MGGGPRDESVTEALLMHQFDHPHIVRLLGVCAVCACYYPTRLSSSNFYIFIESSVACGGVDASWRIARIHHGACVHHITDQASTSTEAVFVEC